VDAIPLISVLAAVVGSLVVVQSVAFLPEAGQAAFMGELLVLLLLRELGPLLVAFVVIARSGTAIAAELGTMGVRGELDGLVGVGVDPLSYLVWPRMVGVGVAVISLTVVFNAVSFLFGFGVAAILNISASFDYLLETLFKSIHPLDILVSSFKSGAFGIAIAGICAAHGLAAHKSSTEIPQRSLSAVVSSLRAVLVIELVVTLLFSDLEKVIR
jgi:phospholipid/cholesterol/gamma-HCH transport system permease protein